MTSRSRYAKAVTAVKEVGVSLPVVVRLEGTNVELGKPDRFGRTFEKKLEAPYCAIKVTGALFHTQGGLAIDARTRVLRQKGPAFLNLFAAGGAAVGVSGMQASGYLSGNGLLTATVFGRMSSRPSAAGTSDSVSRYFGSCPFG